MKNIFLFLILSLASKVKPINKTLWFDILIQNNKIGYNVLQYSIDNNEIRVKDLSFMEINMLGSTKRVKLTDESVFTGNYALKSSRFTLNTPEQTTKGNAFIRKDSLIVNFTTGNTQGRKAFYTGKKKVIISSLVYVMIKEKTLKETQNLLVFDPSTISLEPAFIKKDKNGVITFKYGNYLSKISVSNGIIIDRGPMGLITRETTQQEALKLTRNPFALLDFFAVKPDKPLKQNGKYVKLKITGIDRETELNFSYQKVIKRTNNSAIVEIRLPDSFPEYVGKIPESIKKYLEPTPFLQSDDPEIQNLAMQVTQDATNDREKVQRILDFVYEYLKKEPVVSLPSALDVLHMKKGDCNEHSVLFAALARAAGIPTEITVGLIYQNGAYYYHAWDAVYLGEKWYFVDPIFHEFPADIGHIMLKRGGIEKQSDIIGIVGKLKISILNQY